MIGPLFSLLLLMQHPAHLRLGYVNSATIRAALHSDDAERFAPGVVVVLRREGMRTVSTAALTNETGYAFFPVVEGRYCASAYGTDGAPIKLDRDSSNNRNRCFTVRAGEAKEASLTLAADAQYASKVPNLGIE